MARFVTSLVHWFYHPRQVQIKEAVSWGLKPGSGCKDLRLQPFYLLFKEMSIVQRCQVPCHIPWNSHPSVAKTGILHMQVPGNMSETKATKAFCSSSSRWLEIGTVSVMETWSCRTWMNPVSFFCFCLGGLTANPKTGRFLFVKSGCLVRRWKLQRLASIDEPLARE